MQPASRFCALRGVRVAGGDLCRRQSAEAPTEPAGETGLALFRYLEILFSLFASQNFDRCANKSSLYLPQAAVGCVAFEKDALATPSKLYHFPKKEHCKVAGVPIFAMLQP